ncbi:MAG: acyl-CoA dehydrogenase C-terminal domain-containing protein, partial [Pseudomonas sp.]|nr:acyl-CoA dehydrogenase C-terminal domain-containing protein [Pseudomonas sp.]
LFCKENEGNAQFGDYIKKVSALNAQWGEMTQKIAMKAMQNREEIGSAAMDYLMFSGYVTLAFFWVKMAMAAQKQLDAGTTETDFYKAKLATQEFYFKRLLPRAQAHVEALESGADNLMQLTADQF